MASFMFKNYYDFIEIGTCDFDTLIQKADNEKRGLSIEPLKYYLDRLPDRKNCTKICAAISNYEGEGEMYYLQDEDIQKYELPNLFRGGGTLNKKHIWNQKYLKDENKPDIFKKTKVKITRLKSIIDQYKIDGIKILKIDTEGCDDLILLDYFDCCKNEGYPYPYMIKYEQALLSYNRRCAMLNTAMEVGYIVQEEDISDTVLIRKANHV